jgi:hypothetical protein
MYSITKTLRVLYMTYGRPMDGIIGILISQTMKQKYTQVINSIQRIHREPQMTKQGSSAAALVWPGRPPRACHTRGRDVSKGGQGQRWHLDASKMVLQRRNIAKQPRKLVIQARLTVIQPRIFVRKVIERLGFKQGNCDLAKRICCQPNRD